MTAALAPRPPAAPGDATMDSRMDSTVDAAVAGNVRAFTRLVERHRGELYLHCVRILRSPEQAEDALQEALLRAWRSRAGYAGRSTFRAWLYRIATNACLDEIRRDRGRTSRRAALRLVPLDDETQLPPAAMASAEPGPDVALEAKEALEGALRTAVDLLPPRQRAVLILCAVLRCPAVETAALLDTTVAAVNSALQRARATLSGEQAEPAGTRISDRRGTPEQPLLDRYVEAVRRHDVAAVIALARAEAAR
jgi:RNA polymerase sigma-70 factor, ECF subfamily